MNRDAPFQSFSSHQGLWYTNAATQIATVTTAGRVSGDVAQLVRALPCHGRGRGFEPRRPRHSFQIL